MGNKDYREIQVSSSLLILVFIGVLALGVFVFLLGVNVGKKQTDISAPSHVVTERIPEPVKEAPAPSTEPLRQQAPAYTPPTDTPAEKAEVTPPAAAPSAPLEVRKQEPSPAPAKTAPVQPAPKASSAAPGGLYYIQVGAFTSKAQAQASADKFRKKGYPVVIADPRPTDAKTWYRVRVGGFKSKDKAAETLNKLNSSAGKKTDFRLVKD